MRSLGIGVEQVSDIRQWRELLYYAHKYASHRTFQRQVSKFVIDITVDDDDIASRFERFLHHHSQVDGVQQIKRMARDGQIPGADVLVATVHRLVRRADAAFAS